MKFKKGDLIEIAKVLLALPHEPSYEHDKRELLINEGYEGQLGIVIECIAP